MDDSDWYKKLDPWEKSYPIKSIKPMDEKMREFIKKLFDEQLIREVHEEGNPFTLRKPVGFVNLASMSMIQPTTKPAGLAFYEEYEHGKEDEDGK